MEKPLAYVGGRAAEVSVWAAANITQSKYIALKVGATEASIRFPWESLLRTTPMGVRDLRRTVMLTKRERHLNLFWLALLATPSAANVYSCISTSENVFLHL